MASTSTQLEFSAGGVVYRQGPGGYVEVVLIATQDGQRWGLPKGWIEKGEQPEEAALREVREETGLNARIIERLDRIEYWFWRQEQEVPIRVHKFVYFFLMEGTDEGVLSHDWEVDEAGWFPIEEAIRLAWYRGERQILEKAKDRLTGPIP